MQLNIFDLTISMIFFIILPKVSFQLLILNYWFLSSQFGEIYYDMLYITIKLIAIYFQLYLIRSIFTKLFTAYFELIFYKASTSEK